ncbi:methionyl-tRNA formyltransferase [Candidatus Auribacterota bacterium]
MNVILLTRTDRPSGALTALEIYNSSHNLLAVIAEERIKMLTRKESIPAVLYRSIMEQGIKFTISKITEQLRIRAHYLLRKHGLKKSGGTYLSINEFLLDHSVPYHTVENHNSPETVKIIGDLCPDIIVLCNTRVIKPDIINIPSKGCLNLHLGKLPEYRGMSSCFWEIYNGEERGGITVHFIDDKLDSGDIVLEEGIDINNNDTEHTLYNRKLPIGTKLITKALDLISEGGEKRITQDPNYAKMYHLPTKEEYRSLKQRK